MIAFFPSIYPDELLYSVLSRYYIKSGYGDSNEEKIKVEFYYSEDDLKTEAARGLLRIEQKNNRESHANIFLKNCGKSIAIIDGQAIPVGEDENVCANDYIESFFSPNNDKHVSAIEIKFDPNDDLDDFTQYIKIMNDMFFETSDEKINLDSIDKSVMNRKIKEVIDENKRNHTIASSFIIKLEALIEYLHDC